MPRFISGCLVVSTDFSVLLIVFSFGISIWASAHALLHKEHSRAAFSWIVVCWVVPYLGALIYFWFGNDRVRKRAAKLSGLVSEPGLPYSSSSRVPLSRVTSPHLQTLAETGQQISEFPLEENNQVEPLYAGDQVYQAMLKAIHEAAETIYLASYIFNYDEVGKQFVDALKAASQRGVKVYVLVDGIGEWYSRPAISKVLTRQHIRTARFYPPTLFPPSLYFNIRNHRKILVVDGIAGFVGGMNIYRKHSSRYSEGNVGIRDTHFRVSGPIVLQLARVFENDWNMASDERLQNAFPIPYPDVGNQLCRTVVDGPDESLDSLLFLLLAAVNSAQRTLDIVTPYFIAHESLMRSLQTAALRGVQVRIVLPKKSNLWPVDWASRHMWGQLLQRGVNIYLQPEPFDHSKLLLVDRSYAMIGSANIDPRSIRLNYEILVEVYDADFASALAEHVDSLVAVAQPFDYQQWHDRSLAEKLRDGVFWLFSPYL